ncbi:MAG TPA: type II toxin-antitoxin system VapC family toxin [Armatimonadota bacterium]
MRACVIDCSITLAALFPESGSAFAVAALTDHLAGEIWVPSLWLHELASGLCVAVKRGRVPQQDADEFLDLVAHLPLKIDPPPGWKQLKRVMALAAEQGLTAYDACYLELALRRSLPLATLDQQLRLAARSLRLEYGS